MSGGWQWWAGSDNERFTEGPFETMQQAIDAGWDQGLNDANDGEGFYIIEATKGRLQTDIFDENVLEEFDEQNYENYGEDQDGVGEHATKEQANELVVALNRVVRDWVERHNMHQHAFRFQGQRNLSFIRRKKEGE